MDSNNLVKISHDSQIINAYQKAVEKIDYFHSRYNENQNNEYVFLVKIGFSINKNDHSPVIPLSTIEENKLNFYSDYKNCNKTTDEEIDAEWIWVIIKKWNDNQISGTINNNPIYRKDLNFGTILEFSEKAIIDWIIAKEGELIEGNFLKNILLSNGKPIK